MIPSGLWYGHQPTLVLGHGGDFEKFDFDERIVLRVSDLPAGK
jgi:hypothetical protein